MKNIILFIAFFVSAVVTAAAAELLPYQDTRLTAEERAEDLLSRLTVEEKISLMMDRSPAIERLGIKEYNWWNEALHGIGRAGVATVLPQAIGMAATFDEPLMYNAFSMISDEARAKYNMFKAAGDLNRYHCLTFWTPNINIFRDPRWGRGQETYGEDPCLTARLGVAAVRGLQGDNPEYMKTIACAKHFAVHSGPEWNRHSFDAANVDLYDLWGTYLPAFKALVDAGVGQVMCAYNRFEGEPCCSSKRLLHQMLREQWGYDKIIVSDCSAIRDFYVDWGHRTHPTQASAAGDAVMSGTDLECGSDYKHLGEALANGEVDMAHIDASLKRLLIARFSLGELGGSDVTPWDEMGAESVDSPRNREIALQMARESMVLLKNNGILPLPEHGKRILVVGPNAADSVMQWGNYSGTPSHTITILDGIRAIAPDAAYARGCDHVVSSSMISCFDGFKGGVKGEYRNTLDTAGEVVATQTYTTPIALDGGGATVFAPGVNLNNFSGMFTGEFVPAETGFYVIEFEASKGEQVLYVDNKEVARREAGGRQDHKASYMFEGKKGVAVPVGLYFNNGEDVASLKFDIKTALKESIDPTEADVIVFVGGISPKLEGEEMKVSVPGFRGGDRETIELPAVQRQLIAELKASGKPVVMVNCSGSAVGLAAEDSICDAIVQAWYPGQEGGTAVADVLFGRYNPSGRLPVTFYRDDSQLPDFQDYSMEGRTYRFMTEEPLYPFGHGLSYTTFEYSDARAFTSESIRDNGVSVSVRVTNTGKVAGEEVVQVYFARKDIATGTVKSLVDFARVGLKAGESQFVTFDIDGAAVATWDNKSQQMKQQAGEYEIMIGGSSSAISARVPLMLK